ncbi:carbohydrate kinase [Neomegalonema sp.]|uniref:carbohydrate kinase n=1 Tax=Neomegalonema sp. TaxID=2039713 RepID=UPI002612C6AB|nr:carbohydrate kinase [Neomegalonema sp.]MDD2867818.1 winged helix-turn-helix transcriptional regulator [Neomegalonema sp.]
MDELTAQEAAVLALISRNPFAGQQEIAEALGFARSTVAAHVASLTRKGFLLGRGYVLPQGASVLCVGGAVMDRRYRLLAPARMETSNPAEGSRSHGGVARNVAENLALLGRRPGFLSVVGDDEPGRLLLEHLRGRGVDVSRVLTLPGARTAEYVALLDPSGELVLAAADMAIFDRLTPEDLLRAWPHVAGASWVFADANLTPEALACLCARRGGGNYRLAVDAVSVPKTRRLPADLSGIDLLFLNADEAAALLDAPRATSGAEALAAARALCDRGAGSVRLSRGAAGAALAGEGFEALLPAVAAEVVDVTGAGDAAMAGTLHALLAGEDPVAAARLGGLMAALTIEAPGAVRDDLTPELLAAQAGRRSFPAPADLHGDDR